MRRGFTLIDRSLLLTFAVVLGARAAAAQAPQAAGSQTPTASQTQTMTTQTAAPAPPRPPFPNRLNTVMPAWLRLRGEFRERAEGVASSAFVAGRDDLYWLSRFRFDATVKPNERLAFQVQAQDARVASKQVGTIGAPFKAAFDLRMAFADVGAATSRVSLRAGRQELAFGEQRLVGHVSWLNAARTFDGARATVRAAIWKVDVFAASVVRILDGEFDKSGNGNRFLGAYGSTTAVIPSATVEPYVFWRRDRNVATESAGGPATSTLTTVGARAAGKLPRAFEYDFDVAAQTGGIGGDDIAAWAGHARLRTPALAAGARVTGEFNYASGDANPKDGKRGTFDQLYPTPHDKYGLADQVGWRNVQHVRVGFDVTPFKGWPVTTNYHSWWLADRHDGVYAAGGAPLVPRVAAGAASRHVGQEIDVQVSRALTPQLQLVGGYAHIFPGAFLKDTTPGASYRLPFLMVTYVFFAER